MINLVKHGRIYRVFSYPDKYIPLTIFENNRKIKCVIILII